jgi:hypothetical protein
MKIAAAKIGSSAYIYNSLVDHWAEIGMRLLQFEDV